MFRIKHTTSPITFRLLARNDRFCQCPEKFDISIPIFIRLRKVFQHFSQSSKYPAIPSCPKVFLAIHTLMFGINIFTIPIIQSRLFIIHQTIGISQIFMQFFQIKRILCNFIKLCHYRHYHIQTICPPPIVMS